MWKLILAETIASTTLCIRPDVMLCHVSNKEKFHRHPLCGLTIWIIDGISLLIVKRKTIFSCSLLIFFFLHQQHTSKKKTTSTFFFKKKPPVTVRHIKFFKLGNCFQNSASSLHVRCCSFIVFKCCRSAWTADSLCVGLCVCVCVCVCLCVCMCVYLCVFVIIYKYAYIF